MTETAFSIEKKYRKQLSRGNKIYRIMYGLIIIGASIYMISGMGFSFLTLGVFVIGLAYFIHGIIGKGIVPYTAILIMDDDSIFIKKTYEREVRINFNEVSFIRFMPLAIDVSFMDTVKKYNLSWLSPDEFETLSQRLKIICSKKQLPCE